MMETNGHGLPPGIAQVPVMPIITTMPTDSCSVGVLEETEATTGRTYRELVVIHPNGTQINLRFYNLERARQVGRALVKSTPKDERGEKIPTPLRDSMRQYTEGSKNAD